MARRWNRPIAPATYAEVKRRAEKAGLPMIALDRMKPWMVAVALTAPALKAAGFDTDLGIDKHFFDKAKETGKELRALETVAYQLGQFDQLSPALQELMLKETMSDLDTQVANVKEVATAWAAGNTATIERVMLKDMLQSPELYQKLLVERNQNWIAPIETCLQTERRMHRGGWRRTPHRSPRCSDPLAEEGLQGRTKIGCEGCEGCEGCVRCSWCQGCQMAGARVRTRRLDFERPAGTEVRKKAGYSGGLLAC